MKRIVCVKINAPLQTDTLREQHVLVNIESVTRTVPFLLLIYQCPEVDFFHWNLHNSYIQYEWYSIAALDCNGTYKKKNCKKKTETKSSERSERHTHRERERASKTEKYTNTKRSGTDVYSII